MVLRKEKSSRSRDAFSIVMVNRLAVLASRSGKPIASAATPMPTTQPRAARSKLGRLRRHSLWRRWHLSH